MIDGFKAAGDRGNLNGNDARPTQTPTQTVNPQPQQPLQVRPAPVVQAAAPVAPAAPRMAQPPAATPIRVTNPATSAASLAAPGSAHPLAKVPMARQALTAPHGAAAPPNAEQVGANEYLTKLANGETDEYTDYQDVKLPWFRRVNRRQWMVVGGVLLIAIGGSVSYALTRPSAVANTPVVASKPKPQPPAPENPVSPLTGDEVALEDTKRTVTGVMIENTVFARPQSGLMQAGVVYEAIAEAGITRYLALFQEGKPANLGPVRSARPYYVDWAHSFDAPLAHVGGSPDALAKIKAEGTKDLDQFFNPSAYRRIGSREAPHNMYTTIDQLNKLEAAKGWTSSSFTGFDRKKHREVALPDLSKLPQTSVANTVNIAISGPTYNVSYHYDRASNTYKRFLAGEPHIDAETHAQLAPTVVIALATAYGLEADGYHSKYQITGGGKAFVFEEGTVTPIDWSRPTGPSQYSFTGPDGKPFKLDPGQTWITMVGSPSAVSYKP